MPTTLRATRFLISMVTTSFLLCLLAMLWLSACTVTQPSTPFHPPRRPPGAVFGKVFAKLDGPSRYPIALPDLPIALHEVGEDQSDMLVDTVDTNGLGDYEFVDLQPGRYRVCWDQVGWISDCSAVFAVGDNYAYPPDIYVAPVVQQASNGTIRLGVLWGNVSITTTGDSLVIPSYRSVDVTLTNEAYVPLVTSARVNSYGEWIATNVPMSANFVLARLADVTTTVEIGPSPALRRGQFSLPLTLRLQTSEPGESSLIEQAQHSALTPSNQNESPDCQPARWTKPVPSFGDHSFLSATGWVGQGTRKGADDYYNNLVGAGDPRRKLTGWWGANGFNKDGVPLSGTDVITAHLSYLNTTVLGVGRNMNCRLDQRTGEAACYVSNYSEHGQGAALHLNPKCADWATNSDICHLVNTVAMEYAPVGTPPEREWIVKFLAFDDNGDLDPDLRLGGNPVENYVPNLCRYCHGGKLQAANQPQDVDLKASFREFDGRTFVFPGCRSFNEATAEELENLRRLNQIVLATDPARAISETIHGWYTSTETIEPADYIPAGWKSSDDPSPIVPLQEQEELYRRVVNPSCRVCHIAFGMSFSSYEEFRERKDDVKRRVCNKETGLSPMPHAKIPYLRFWTGENPQVDIRPADFLAKFNGPGWNGPLGSCPP